MPISTRVGVRAMSGSIGAEVRGVDLSRDLDDDVIADIRAAWLEHLVLFFPGQDLTRVEKMVPVEHPVNRQHPETGRNALFVNPGFTARLKGFDGSQSAGLLRLLYKHATQPEFICRYRWEPGALAFWDNRATMRYGVHDYGTDQRVMHRVTLRGDRPIGPPSTSEGAKVSAAPRSEIH